jgi:hypothetical protein
MTTIGKIILAASIAAAGSPFALATSINGSCTSVPSQPTELVNAAVTCGQLNTSLLPTGAVVTEVQLTIDGEITGTIDLTNNAATAQTVEGTTTSNFFETDALAGFTIPSPVVNPSFTTGFQTIGAGATYDSPLLSSSGTPQVLADTTVFAPYEGTGTFALAFSTISGFNLTGGGGQVASAQVTDATATVGLVYEYTVPSGTPEPASMLLMGVGLVGLGIYRKRMKA